MAVNMKKTILFTLALVIAGGAGFGLQRILMKHDDLAVKLPQEEFNVVLGQPRPDFELKDLDGHVRNVREWDGKVLMVNFWASWCPPCLKETPLLIALQNKFGEKGLQVVGLAIDDEQSVRDFVDTQGVTYPVMAGELVAMELAKRYGNRVNALPFTAFVDRNGDIVQIKVGEIEKEEAEKVIETLL
jgi:thiol-disulfide isomerase/thioredoxin